MPTVYELQLQEEEFSVKLANGVLIEYVLSELTGAGRDKYLASINARMKKDANGNTVIQKFEGMQALLLCLAIRHKSTDALVTEQEVQVWPARMVVDLFNKARKLSGLDEDAEADAKNDEGEES